MLLCVGVVGKLHSGSEDELCGRVVIPVTRFWSGRVILGLKSNEHAFAEAWTGYSCLKSLQCDYLKQLIKEWAHVLHSYMKDSLPVTPHAPESPSDLCMTSDPYVHIYVHSYTVLLFHCFQRPAGTRPSSATTHWGLYIYSFTFPRFPETTFLWFDSGSKFLLNS